MLNDISHDIVFNCDISLANKGFWADLLGFGDFYFELSVQITEICIATRPQNGGLIEIEELKRRVKAKRGTTNDPKAQQQEISELVDV